jgi:hypothetical protein
MKVVLVIAVRVRSYTLTHSLSLWERARVREFKELKADC